MSSSSDLEVVLGPIQSGGIAEALAALPGVSVTPTRSRDEVPGTLQGREVLVTYLWRDDFLVPGLRWVQSISAGVEQFPIPSLEAAGVILTSARGIHGPQVAEHAFALLLAMTRGVAESVRAQVRHEWAWPPVDELAGMRMGILGLGVIGEAIAVRARAFGMDVIGTKRVPASYAGVASEVLMPGQTIEVCERSDVVVIALPGGSETEGLVAARELAALGNGWLVNVGRGSVVDEWALVAALREGRLRGAALDVFTNEPIRADSPLWDTPNLIVSPHLGGVTPHYGARLAGIFERNLEALRGRGEWVNRVV